MSPIRSIAELAGIDLTKEGWGIAVVYRVYYHVGSGIRDVGYYRFEHIAEAVMSDHPLNAHLTKEPRLALVNLTQGFELVDGCKFSLSDTMVLPCALVEPDVRVPPLRFREEDDFIPRHPYHRSDESEGPDPSTHPSWRN